MSKAVESISVVEAWDMLIPAVSAVESRLGKALRRYGLGQSEFRTLRILAGTQDNEVRLLDLADDVGLDRSSVSRLVTRLEDAELVRRESCGDDRRGVYTVLTEKGHSLYESAHDVYAQTLIEALASVELPEEVFDSLAQRSAAN
ncbi:MAG: MarR family transcriptional regulator [Micropruina sp.]|uniref:MarR family winged helix-turn-helix transcriptional regulator n=1 Tax=Micropruina sp. TaxID=2737536 RepID=UPI0039E3B8AF